MKNNKSIWNEMRRMQQQMDSLFDSFFSSGNEGNKKGLIESMPEQSLKESDYRNPACNYYETENNIIAELELPGIDKKDINVSVDDKGIEVNAETKYETENNKDKKGYYSYERSYSGFHRKFALPENVDPQNAEAEYKNGLLKITVPKKEIEKSTKKQLEVK
ncbi:MAG: Hsp20/alpha crystallin family protein [Nanobdellota archaeon]